MFGLITSFSKKLMEYMLNINSLFKSLLGNVSLFAQKNRENFLKEENQVYKMRALEYHQPEYFEEFDNNDLI